MHWIIVSVLFVYLWFGWHYSDSMLNVSHAADGHSKGTRYLATMVLAIIWPLTLLMQLAVKLGTM